MKYRTMETDSIKIERNKTAPSPAKRRGRKGKWNPLFASMRVGDWFVVDKINRSRVSQNASLYLKGKYSMYKHPENEEQYIFVRKA